MEITKCINRAIDYIEDNICSILDIDEIAKTAFTSRYHFQRMFHALTGFTLTEYIRNRRLTLAAEELCSKDIKIIDIALKYGYENSDAFTKAFKRFHGVAPSALKNRDISIKAFPKLSFELSIKGETEMIYRIVEKNEFRMFGVSFLTTIVGDNRSKEIPEFCQEIWENGVHYHINEFLGYPRMHMLHGIHYDFRTDGSRRYMMGWEAPAEQLPEEFEILDIPSNTWVVFQQRGDKSKLLVIQNLWERIYAEWFPSSGFEQIEGPCIEKYFWDDDKYDEYTCEIWIPIK